MFLLLYTLQQSLVFQSSNGPFLFETGEDKEGISVLTFCARSQHYRTLSPTIVCENINRYRGIENKPCTHLIKGNYFYSTWEWNWRTIWYGAVWTWKYGWCNKRYKWRSSEQKEKEQKCNILQHQKWSKISANHPPLRNQIILDCSSNISVVHLSLSMS